MENVRNSQEDLRLETTLVQRSPVESVSFQSGDHVSMGTYHSCNDCHKLHAVENSMILQSTLLSRRRKMLRLNQKQKMLHLLRESSIILQKANALHQMSKNLMQEDDNDVADGLG